MYIIAWIGLPFMFLIFAIDFKGMLKREEWCDMATIVNSLLLIALLIICFKGR